MQGGVTSAQLAEASRLVNVGGSPEPPPAPVVACVARVVVQNPLLDQAANDIAQMPKDLRQQVMYSYLQCGYDYVLGAYMRFAPPGLAKAQLTCIRSKFKELDVNLFAEVIVEDPDAGYTGPLLIQACKSGSAKSNPLLNSDGSLIGMGGS